MTVLAFNNRDVTLLDANREWRRTPIEERAARLLDVADRLGRADAELIVREMRKTIRGAVAEIERCVALVRFYASEAPGMLAPVAVSELTGSRVPGSRPPGNSATRELHYFPLGTVLGVMPWNFPYWQVFRFAVPALLAGNTVVVKHSSLVPRCADALEELFGDDIFRIARVSSDGVYPLVADERVRAVVMTGGVEAGSSVAAYAGKHIKKVVLELGGSDAFVVMPSADLDAAVAAGVRSRLHCNGQACTAAKRFIVHRDVADEFEARFAHALRTLRIGDPMDPRTDLGPLATEEIATRLARQVEETVSRGARVVTGGRRLDATTYAPTLLAHVPRRSPAAQEETFGPVAALFRANDLEHAIDIANDTPFGLGASVWTSDAAESERLIDALDVGQVFVNTAVSSRFALPFGGTKQSGFGRELGAEGIRELTNIKAVCRG